MGKGPLDRGAWRGDPQLKERILELMREDQQFDRLKQGVYLRDYNRFAGETAQQAFRGCHIGCLMMAHKRATQYTPHELAEVVNLESMALAVQHRAQSWHDELPDALGIPSWVGHMWDSTFEQVTAERAPRFAVLSLEVLPVGADCRPLMPMLASWLVAQVDESRLRPSEAFTALKADLVAALEAEIEHPDPMVWITLRERFRSIAGWMFRGNHFDKFTYNLIMCMGTLGGSSLMEAMYEASLVAREGQPVADVVTAINGFHWQWAQAIFTMSQRLPLVGPEVGR